MAVSSKTALQVFMITCSLVLTTLSGCSNKETVKVNEDNAPLILNSQHWQAGDEALDQAEELYQQAYEKKLQRFAPKHMSQAEELLEQAGDSSSQEEKTTLAKKIQETLSDAESIKQQSEKFFQPLLNKQSQLQQLKADAILSAEYKQLDRELLALFSLYEINSKKVPQQDLNALKNKMEIVRINTLLETHLAPAIALFDKTQQEQANKFAPTTCDMAAQHIIDSEKFIRKNPDDIASIETEGKKVQNSILHCLYIARESEFMSDMSNSQAEQKVLNFEQQLFTISQLLGQQDYRNMALQDQVLAIRQAIIESQQEQHHEQQKAHSQREQQLEFRIQQLEYELQKADIPLPETSAAK